MIAVLTAALLAATSGPAIDENTPRDIFLGTLALENGVPVLTRCDVAANRYILRDAPGAKAVKSWARDGRRAYGEVIAAYDEQFGKPGLAVFAIDHLTLGKSCHLSDIPQITVRPAPRPDPAFTGHYYLSGVMETGSELLLRPDGTFEWFVSYGSVDRSARGTWAKDDEDVVLTAQAPATDKPLFTYREVEPWSEAAEDELLRRRYDEADERVREKCPFMAIRVMTAAPALPAFPSLAPTPAPTPSPKALRADAAAALQRALALREQAEAQARAEMTDTRRADAAELPDHMTATELFDAYDNARWEAQQAAQKADLPEPDLKDPDVPAACALAQRRMAADIPRARWTRGVGVRVYDMASEQGAYDVAVTFRFADGTEGQAITANRGLALLPGNPSAPLVSIRLSANYAPGRDQSVTVPPTSSGIVDLTIDAEQLVTPPFETMRLRIDGKALIPGERGWDRGRYERQP